MVYDLFTIENLKDMLSVIQFYTFTVLYDYKPHYSIILQITIKKYYLFILE